MCIVLQLAAANLFDAMSNPEHELQPYLASLPKRDEILCPLVDMPHKYLSLIHNNIAVRCSVEGGSKHSTQLLNSICVALCAAVIV